jgi:hypothetical protein
MTNANTERSNAARFEFAFTLLISIAIAATAAVLISGICWFLWK